jgi:hypothetical protein
MDQLFSIGKSFLGGNSDGGSGGSGGGGGLNPMTMFKVIK